MKFNLFYATAQLWRLDGDLLRNKANNWKSNDAWRFKPEDLVYIEDISNDQVLTITNENIVKKEIMMQNDARQIWEKGEVDKEGYFTMSDRHSKKVLTAVSTQNLIIDGNRLLSNIIFWKLSEIFVLQIYLWKTSYSLADPIKRVNDFELKANISLMFTKA